MSQAVTTKLLKLLHVVLAAAWLGAVIVIFVLVCAGDARLDRAAFVVGDVVVWSSVTSLASALLLATTTPWGFFRFRFVNVKWLVLAQLALLGVFVRTPLLNTLAARADVDGVAAGLGDGRGVALVVVGVEAACLLAIFAISVLRPWGRSQRTPEPPRWLRATAVVVFVFAVVFAAAQSLVLRGLRHTTIAAVDVSGLADGVYGGVASVGVAARVSATVAGGRLVDVSVVALPSGTYADLARGVTTKMVRAQRVDVDGVSGATTTSRAVQAATAAALAARPLHRLNLESTSRSP